MALDSTKQVLHSYPKLNYDLKLTPDFDEVLHVEQYIYLSHLYSFPIFGFLIQQFPEDFHVI